jgi:DNA excision repair protein ERCC-4
MEGVAVKSIRLAVGDYLVNSRFVFERKTLIDFAASIKDGRLFPQMTRLSNTKEKPVLILEGTGRMASNIGVRREAVQGAIISISLYLGIPILRSISPEETARLMVYAARQNIRSHQLGYQRNQYRPQGKRKRQLYILQGLPGIGRSKAARLLDHFNSVEEVMSATCEELEAVEGIGRHAAKKIRYTVKESLSNYGEI